MNAQKAKKAIQFYKGCKGHTDGEKSALKSELERLKLVVEQQKLDKKFKISDICNRLAVKGIVTSIAMAWFIQMPGSIIFVYYTTVIFEKSGSMFDVNLSSIALAIVQIVGGLVSSFVGDAFGRRKTIFISLFGSAVGLFSFSTYMFLRANDQHVSSFTWLPVVSLSLIIFISNAGIIALANVCAIENFPSNVRTFAIFYLQFTDCNGF